MKRLLLGLCVVSLFFSASARSQSAAQPGGGQSDAEKLFLRLKTLAGQWKGEAAMGPGMRQPVHVSLRITSGGAALMHEMVPEGRSDDPTRGDDDPVTMFYLDGNRLRLTHYCDTGNNRPRMEAHSSADGKTAEFHFLDLAGATMLGHMHAAAFTFIDANHHTEDWTYMAPDGKPGKAHITLTRVR